jgi:hypothetical protein
VLRERARQRGRDVAPYRWLLGNDERLAHGETP